MEDGEADVKEVKVSRILRGATRPETVDSEALTGRSEERFPAQESPKRQAWAV